MEAGASRFTPDQDCAYGLALCVPDLDLSLGGAGKNENHQSDNRSERGKGSRCHALDYIQICGDKAMRGTDWSCSIHRTLEYTA